MLHFTQGSLTTKQIIELAAGIYMDLQYDFEVHQGSFAIIGIPIPGAGGSVASSFAVDDLPSDYIGMMRAANDKYPGEGVSDADMRSDCKILDLDQSLDVLRLEAPGLMHAYTRFPIFRRPVRSGDTCWPCKNSPNLPAWFRSYSLTPSGGATWQKMATATIYGRYP